MGPMNEFSLFMWALVMHSSEAGPEVAELKATRTIMAVACQILSLRTTSNTNLISQIV